MFKLLVQYNSFILQLDIPITAFLHPDVKVFNFMKFSTLPTIYQWIGTEFVPNDASVLLFYFDKAIVCTYSS